jgi:hypothetical protein
VRKRLKSPGIGSRSNLRKNDCQHRSTSAGVAPPQPDRLEVAVAGQVLDLQPDQGPFDDRQVTVVIEPGGAVG